MTNTNENMIPAPGTVICGCDEDAACSFHARAFTKEATMPCYCKNDTPCQPCVDAFHEDCDRDGFNAAVAALMPSPVVDDRNWTPDDEDDREHDRKILADMVAEGYENPDMAHALLTLFADDNFTAADLDALRKQDAKWTDSDGCACNSCADAGKWFNQ